VLDTKLLPKVQKPWIYFALKVTNRGQSLKTGDEGNLNPPTRQHFSTFGLEMQKRVRFHKHLQPFFIAQKSVTLVVTFKIPTGN
jgi:hypothetical protein